MFRRRTRITVLPVALGVLVLGSAHAENGHSTDGSARAGSPTRHLSAAEADALVHGRGVRGVTPVAARLSGSQIRCYDHSLAPTACTRARDCGLPYFITGALC